MEIDYKILKRDTIKVTYLGQTNKNTCSVELVWSNLFNKYIINTKTIHQSGIGDKTLLLLVGICKDINSRHKNGEIL